MLGDDLLQESGSVSPQDTVGGPASCREVQVVDRVPSLRRKDVAACPEVLAGVHDARVNAAGIRRIGNQERNDRGLVAGLITFVEAFPTTRDAQQVSPVGRNRQRHIDDDVGVLAHDARSSLGAFEIAGRPIQTFGHAREEHHDSSTTQVSFEPPPCDELTTSEPSTNATRVRPPVVT